MTELLVEGELVRVVPDRTINAGYSGRDQEAVQDHIDELVAEGIPEPDRVPGTYQVAPYTLLVAPDEVQVAGPNTSGEAEFGLVITGDETYVVAASDHTDRALETEGIQKAKQIAPNVVSRRAWRYDDVRDHWDEITLRSWNTVDGERRLYQETTLAEILPPESLLEAVTDRYGGPVAGTVVLSGTVAPVSGGITPGTPFEVELADPELDRSLDLAYDVRTI
jgi:hypothetical protein